MAADIPAAQPVSVSVSADHYVRLAWQDEDGTPRELKLNPGQATAIGGFASLARQSYEFAQREP